MSHSPNTRTRLVWRGGKKVRKHRWLMEQQLGRKLEPWEHVHHKDGDPLNNDLNNLQVIEEAEHMRLHKAHPREPKLCAHCGVEFVPWQRQHKRQKCCSRECAQAMRLEARRWATIGCSSEDGMEGYETGSP
jgi:hypothetical protein